MYVITGATGHTGKTIALSLLGAGHPVTVVGRDAAKLQPLVDMGAVAAVGDLADAAFMTETFKGAKAVYLLVPPKWDVTNWRAYQLSIVESFVSALRDSGVTHAVTLSSVGAHMPEGCGPVSGLYYLEQGLRGLPGLNVLNLRPGFFMENFYANIGLMKQAGMFGYPLADDVSMPIVHTSDIAAVAAFRLQELAFTGDFNIEYVNGAEDLTMPQVAAIFSEELGTPIAYQYFPADAARAGMIQSGMPETIADGYLELFDAVSGSDYREGWSRTPENTTPTTFADFVRNEFVHAWNA